MSHSLHIGGKEPSTGWEILGVHAGSHIDNGGDAGDLSRHADGRLAEVLVSLGPKHVKVRDADASEFIAPSPSISLSITAPGAWAAVMEAA